MAAGTAAGSGARGPRREGQATAVSVTAAASAEATIAPRVHVDAVGGVLLAVPASVSVPSASAKAASNAPALAYRRFGFLAIARSTTRTNAVGRSARASRSRTALPFL